MLENNDIYVDHRIDGLEIQITRLFINPNVDHRIDGLETYNNGGVDEYFS